jgi:hypothetical protein
LPASVVGRLLGIIENFGHAMNDERSSASKTSPKALNWLCRLLYRFDLEIASALLLSRDETNPDAGKTCRFLTPKNAITRSGGENFRIGGIFTRHRAIIRYVDRPTFTLLRRSCSICGVFYSGGILALFISWTLFADYAVSAMAEDAAMDQRCGRNCGRCGIADNEIPAISGLRISGTACGSFSSQHLHGGRSRLLPGTDG